MQHPDRSFSRKSVRKDNSMIPPREPDDAGTDAPVSSQDYSALYDFAQKIPNLTQAQLYGTPAQPPPVHHPGSEWYEFPWKMTADTDIAQHFSTTTESATRPTLVNHVRA